MVATWLVALKAISPYIDPLVALVKPVFTKKKADVIANQAEVLNQQISELQAASSQNTEHIKELAEQLKKVVEALDQAASNVAAEHRRTRRLCAVAIAVSLVSLIAVAILIVMQWPVK